MLSAKKSRRYGRQQPTAPAEGGLVVPTTTRRRRRRQHAISSLLAASVCISCSDSSLPFTEAFSTSSKSSGATVPVTTRTALYATIEDETLMASSSGDGESTEFGGPPSVLHHNGHEIKNGYNLDIVPVSNGAPSPSLDLEHADWSPENRMMVDPHFGSLDNFQKLATAPSGSDEPFYAHKTTTIHLTPTTTTTTNGITKKRHNGQTNGKKGVTKVSPPKMNGKVDKRVSLSLPKVEDDATGPSRARRVLQAAQNVWGHVSPVQIFESLKEEEQAALNSVGTVVADLSSAQKLKAEKQQSKEAIAVEGKKRRKKNVAANEESSAEEINADAEKQENKDESSAEEIKAEKIRSKEAAILERISRRKKKQLSNLLKNVNLRQTKRMAGITSRSMTGLITALAEEAENISVRMDAREDTPIWRKQIDTVSIEFTRLGFKPLHMGGPDQQLVSHEDDKPKAKMVKPAVEAVKQVLEPIASSSTMEVSMAEEDEEEEDSCPVEYTLDAEGIPIGAVSCADTAFQQIDVDNSGALDKDEIADALVLAASASSQPGGRSLAEAAAAVGEGGRQAIQQLAKQLVDLYDTNDDGVIDRSEYQSMVEDMAALRQVQKERQQKEDEKNNADNVIGSLWNAVRGNQEDVELNESAEQLNIPNVTDGEELGALAEVTLQSQVPETTGKIVLENVKLDLRQAIFGAIPILKHITPGGPLVLEPLKATVTASFTADDIMKSTLCYAGLKQLVTYALRVRVRSLRDLTDGAVFYGRKWKRDSTKAPQVECTKLLSIEIDDQDRAIITGRAKVQAKEDAPVIENDFKLRTKVATPRNGRAIKLSEPEIAIVLACPSQWEDSINKTFAKFNMKPPPKPKPIYSYIPIHSPFNKNDDIGGYYMGEDNRLNSMYIKDKCLRFEMESVLRPGKFLGNHYLAFTVPQRALIITVDRVKNGMRAARRRKKELKALLKKLAKEADKKAHHAEDALALDDVELAPPSGEAPSDQESEGADDKDSSKEGQKPNFISRFVDGYVQAGDAELNREKLAHAISDWFGRQGISDSKSVNAVTKRRIAEV